MKLMYQTHSPFARKVLVFAHEVGLAGQIEVIHHETSPTARNDEVFEQNPLGKVPVLVRPGLSPLFDSDVICGYLDTLHSGRNLIPPGGEIRWQALRLQAVAQGLAESGSAVRWESLRRPAALRYPALHDGYVEKLRTTYAWLERNHFDAQLHVGHIALATALSWIEFRQLPSFREHPKLTQWFVEFEARPSMRKTPLSGETHD